MEQNRATTIFATKGGIVALDSPVKLQLLEILKEGTISFEELVTQTGKAKSTISVHLNDLEKLNLVENKTSAHDKRKKYFVLNSLYLIYSAKPMWKPYNTHMDDITDSILNGGSIRENLFSTIRFGMEAYGIDPNPILKKLGTDFGIKIVKGFNSNDVEGIL
ncbi:MAG: winged helix-turn-helix transcriptional regulator, partial [Spirochaetes bacterium]|nr:winged helix-turn-helix transcriptional regulator [Spirochaetota bacterium]